MGFWDRIISVTIECPACSGQQLTLWQVNHEIAVRLARIFLMDENDCRSVYGAPKKFQTDPYWQDHIQFHEYFHGDNGAGLGANHQTGWTGLIARLLFQFGAIDDFEAAVAAIAAHRKEQ